MNNDNNNDRNKIRRKKVSSSANNTDSTTPKKKSKSKKKNDKFKTLRVVGVTFLVLLVLGTATVTGIVFSALKDVQPVTMALLDERTYETTKIYYENGDLLSNAPTIGKKEPIEYDQLPKDLINAIVAIEDERFYEHNGVDLWGLARSVIKTLLGDTQGGSTIPMQVSKMLLTDTEKSIPRKIKDIYYAYEMSKTLTKEEILTAYLNNFHVGKGLNGAQAGAQGYFSKDAAELELHEAALLAGSTKSPSAYAAYITAKLDGTETKEQLENKLLFFVYSPDSNFAAPTEEDFALVQKLRNMGLIEDDDLYNQLMSGSMIVRKAENNPKAKARQELVLAKMLELNYITQEEHDAAVAAPIEIVLPDPEEQISSSLQDYIEYEVIDALMDNGHTEDEAYTMFSNGGLRIETSIDPAIQEELEVAYENDNNFPGTREDPDGVVQPQSSMVILDYKTGEIKGMVGGRHITGRKSINRATTPRQPGSTIKPLSVYTPAIDNGLTQSEVHHDKRGGYKFDHGSWNPYTTTPGTDYMSLRKSLSYSSNTIAVKTAEMLGDTPGECIDVMVDYLRNFGITTVADNDANTSSGVSDKNFSALTLGGMTNGISPLEMAAAYGALANGGTYIEPTVIREIKDHEGNVIIKTTPEQNRVVDADVAYVMTDMLQAVITEGIGGSAKLPNGMPVAGKTGTTNKELDVWFVGYTPYYVGATYIGDDGGKKNPETGQIIPRQGIDQGSAAAAKLWATVMKEVHKNLEAPSGGFPKPDGVYFTTINLIDGGKATTGSPNSTSAAFLSGTGPSKHTTQNIAPPEPEEEEEEEPEDPNAGDGGTPPTEGGDGSDTETPTPEPEPTPPPVPPTPEPEPTPPPVPPTPPVPPAE